MFRASLFSFAGTNYVGSHWLRNAAAKSVRQRFSIGNQYNKRKHFNFKAGRHILRRRIGGDPTIDKKHGSDAVNLSHFPTAMHRHLPGDVRRRPDEDYYYDRRVDKVEGAWKPRGRYQVFHVGGATETFVCFRCGYPVRSKLQVIKDENWDYRMCYHCYVSVVQRGQQEQ